VSIQEIESAQEQAAVPTERVKTYMVHAVLCALFLFFPTGVAAVCYAARVNPAVGTGDMAAARLASRRAKTLCWISLAVGAPLQLIWLLSR
jgi:hypothetical protein